MSADEDFTNELLALAGEGGSDQPRKKRRQSATDRNGSAKRRRPNDTTDDDLESEDGEVPADPYPLEGKYKDEDDRERLMDMNELDREDILATRLEEQQRYLDSMRLERMYKQTTGQATSDDDEAVSKAAKRKHVAPGTNKTKAQKLVELKAKRAVHNIAKASKREETRRAMSSDSGSGSDMEESDDEEEGQYTKRDEDEKHLRKSPPKPEEEKIEKDDLEKIRLTRDFIEKWCHLPKFGEMVTGYFVRFMVGVEDDGRSVYRVCEITGLAEELARPYKIQETAFNQQAHLKHASASRPQNLDRVSNSPFTDREFDRWVLTCLKEKVDLPTKTGIRGKAVQLAQNRAYVPTEADITEMIARKNRITGKGNLNQAYAEKSRIHQQRALALARRDHAEVTRLDELIRAQEASAPPPPSALDALAKVNERNRKLNLVQVRKAEADEAADRRRQGGLRPPVVRKLHSSGNTPVFGPKDASSQDSIAPLALDGGGLLTPGAETPSGSPSSSPKKVLSQRLESQLATSIELDLGDF